MRLLVSTIRARAFVCATVSAGGCAVLLATAIAAPSKGTSTLSSGLTVLVGAGSIDGSYGFQTLSVVAKAADGGELDVTRSTTFSTSNSAVIRVQNGVALPVGDGQADVTASYGGKTARAKITVRNCKTDADINFPTDITPILIKGGCIGTACHGAANGQGGLKLSFFGYDPDKDREAFWNANGGRRVNPKDPANSLAILKPSGTIPHGGGNRFAKAGPEARILEAWIRAGGPLYGRAGAREVARQGDRTPGPVLASNSDVPNPKAEIRPPELQSITVEPAERTVKVAGSVHQLLVTAHYADGSTKDVTPLARYFSDDDGIAGPKQNGSVSCVRDGEANVWV